jgi:hypothetical protein
LAVGIYSFAVKYEAAMAFVFRIVLESGRTEYRVFRKLADAMQQLQIARNAFDNGRDVRLPDGDIGLVTDYAVLQVTTEDVWTAIDQAKKGEGFVVHDLEREQRRREAEREAERERREAELKAIRDLLDE